MKRHGALLVIISVLLFPSCTHKDLEFDITSEVAVNFDWSAIPKASPEAMRLVVFSSEAQPVFLPANVHDNTTLDLPGGTYQLVGYNSDTEVLHSRGVTWNDFEIFSQVTDMSGFTRLFGTRAEDLPRARGTEDEPFIEQPDPLWTSARDNIRIPGRHLVTMPMTSAVVRYTFTITNVAHLDNVRNIAGTLSGMSESYSPSQQQCSATYCTIPFYLQREDETTTVGTIRTFGYRSDGEELLHKLVIYVETRDGERYYYTFDVTNALEKAGETVNENGDVEVNVEINTLPVPEPIYNGSGLHPMVDKWQEVEIELDL